MLADILLKTAGQAHRRGAHSGIGKYHPRPSSAGPERCIRQMTYHSLGVPTDRDTADRLVAIWDDGHWHEELINDLIRKTTYKLHSEQMPINGVVLDWMPEGEKRYCWMCHESGEEKMVPSNRLHGHIDGIVTDINGEDILLDDKGMNHFTFERYAQGEIPLDYFTQLCIYAHGIQTTSNADLKKMLLLVKNKNTSQFLEFQLEYDHKTDTCIFIRTMSSFGDTIDYGILFENVVGNAVNKFRQIHEYTLKKKVPRRQYYIDHWRCVYCNWNGVCWANYKAEQQMQIERFPDEIETPEGDASTLDLLQTRLLFKSQEKSAKKAEETIKNYMRLHNLTKCEIGNHFVIRKVNEDGKDRFSFKSKK